MSQLIWDVPAGVKSVLDSRCDEPSTEAQWFGGLQPDVSVGLLSVVGYSTPTAPPAYSQPVQGYGTAPYDTNTATVTTTQASYAAPSAYGTQPAYPAYGQQPPAAAPTR